MNVSFPLPDNYFKPLEHSLEDEARWRKLVDDFVTLSLEEERPYLASQYTQVDSASWKLLREKDQLRVYRPRVVDSSSNAEVVLALGTIEGTMEDVIYGIHHVTTQDMRVTTSFLSDDALDSAVLHIFENGTDSDEYRSLALKWRIIQTPGGGLVKNRDGVGLEYMGIDVDERGERYAFHVSETFDHPVCPRFSVQCAIRAKAHTRTIYRQVSPGRVGVYYRGKYTLSGKIPAVLARLTACEIAISVGKSVECSEAKKLTALALVGSPIVYDQRKAGSSMSKCTICKSTPGRLSTRSLGLCHLCSLCVCSKCRSRKYLLSDEKKIAVSCCKQCIVAAKQLTIDPRLPLRLITAAHWRSQHILTGDEESWEKEVRAVESSLQTSRSRRMFSWDGEMHSGSEDSDLLTGATHVSESSAGTQEQLLDEVSSSLPSSQRGHETAAPETTGNQDSEQAQLWRRMNELRVTAEMTYQIAQHNTQLLGLSSPKH